MRIGRQNAGVGHGMGGRQFEAAPPDRVETGLGCQLCREYIAAIAIAGWRGSSLPRSRAIVELACGISVVLYSIRVSIYPCVSSVATPSTQKRGRAATNPLWSLTVSDVEADDRLAIRGRGLGSLMTRRWSEENSNHRSPHKIECQSTVVTVVQDGPIVYVTSGPPKSKL
jgi:hypothetical protein